ncbi:MAG: TrmH family RNA methyltransferase [Candidatus Micrarchaeota archaeon]
MEIKILRLGHRLPRDERISTHVCLVARAFGANSIVYSGQHDSGLEDSIKKIGEHWGGELPIIYEKNAVKFVKKCRESDYTIVHLTMYGMPIQDKSLQIKKHKKLLIIVGSEQVPGQIYELADFNISVTNQPHSEVAALAIVLDRIFDGKELEKHFNGKMKIIPSEKGKKILKS